MSENHVPLAFETVDESGIEIVDRVERLRYRLQTDGSVSPTRVDEEPFLFPVDRAVEVTTSEIVLPEPVSVYVRDEQGAVVQEVGYLDSASIPPGRYSIELAGQIQTYIRVESQIDISANLIEMRLDFGEEQAIQVGAVSWHDRPAGTITTTAEPIAMMDAVSAFGSALKTTTPERSYPSNRGHPPAVQIGDRLDVPDSIHSPETGITLELPPTYEAVYAASPLAYYLGADVVPAQQPRLVTDAGFEHALDSRGSLQHGIERTLKQIFFLDCLVRTEGIYQIDLHERAALEDQIGLDYERLYDRPLAAQVREYLQVPYATLDSHMPKWRLTTHVEAQRDTIEQLPYVIDDLAIVRTATDKQDAEPAAPTAGGTGGDVMTRSAAGNSSTERSYVEPQSDGSMEQAWIGDGVPIGASKLTRDAFENRLDRTRSEGDISITVVLNDSRMDEERDLVSQIYGERDDLPFDVTLRRGLTVDQLREQLRADTEFLHYIGHADDDGFECADGKLDIETLDETGVESFLLNACDSYRQGLDLIEAGSIGGIVTLNDIPNDRAVGIGETLARLLNVGFPLRAALSVTREQSILGGQYIVVGDGGLTVTQAPSRTPNLLDIDRDGDQFEVEIETYTTDDAGIGSLYMPHIGENEQYFLSSGPISSFSASESELGEFLSLENVPVRTDDTLHWSASVTTDDL
ncbi:hypothetical protein [Halovenus marina]|uniref:hypothetical protein n=1 Tax=Halovenus marina TaxID=3396621 RepID=UPI003F57AA3B